MIPSFLFEALFVRGLAVEGTLADALRKAGFDVERIAVSYTRAVFARCLDVARQHLHPGAPVDQGYAALGRAFNTGFQQTMVGRVVGGALVLLGPAGYLKRLPTYLKMTSATSFPTVVRTAERACRVEFRDTHLVPGFMLGALEGGVRATGVEPTLQLEHLGRGSFDILVSWG